MKKVREARRLLNKGNPRSIVDAIDLFNGAAKDLHASGQSQEAIEICEESAQLARDFSKPYEGSFSERSLAEIHAELGNREACLQHLVAFRRLSEAAKSKSQEQISWHVEAWCLQQLYPLGAAERSDIEQAIKATKKSRSMVETYKSTFTEDDLGGPARIRNARLYILEAQLYDTLGDVKKSMQLLDKANTFLRSNDKTTRCELLQTKCSIAPINLRLDITLAMEDEAPEDKKGSALTEVSHQYILSNSLVKGYKKLAETYIFHKKHLTLDEKEVSQKRLAIIYRLVKYHRILKRPQLEPRISKCQLYEAIGDLYDKYYDTLAGKEKKEYKQFMRKNILENYQKVLELQRSDDDALRAYLAMALVLQDLEEYSDSMKMLEKRLTLLQKTEASEDKIIDTRISIFKCMCKLKSQNLEDVFEELRQKTVFSFNKKELFETWADYWKEEMDLEKSEKWEKMADEIEDVDVKNEDDETDILYGKLKDEEIIELAEGENELLRIERMDRHKLEKTNDKGETILHEAVMKDDNRDVVEKLCKMGCNVNAKDYGGWTPLSEAVVHNQFENAKVLIRYNADVNCRSAQSFVNEESQSSSSEINHSRLTPLMDACANGFIDIAKLLIDNKAKVGLKDSAGWTAYKHLKHFIDDTGSAEEITSKHMQFLEFLKNKTDIVAGLDEPPIKIPLAEANQFESDSPEEDMIISRKRPNSSDFGIFSKRRPRSGENSRPSPPPTQFKNRKRPAHQESAIHRHTSSSSLSSNPRRSKSPFHRITSPTTTIRSAPSVFGGDDDDILEIPVRKTPKFGTGKRSSISPSSSGFPIPLQRLQQQQQQQQKVNNSDEIVLTCSFDAQNKDEVRSFKLPLPRNLTIAETKERISSRLSKNENFKFGAVWSKEKCELADELRLSQVLQGSDQNQISLVFELLSPEPHEIYQQISTEPISDVIDRLKLVSTENVLDLSKLFLAPGEQLEITKSLKKCGFSKNNATLDLGFRDLSKEDESNLQNVLEKCSRIKLENSKFSTIFENPLPNLLELEISCVDFSDESEILKIFKNCQNLKRLKFSAIRISGNVEGMALRGIKSLSNLKSLDLTFNNWITAEMFSEFFNSMENLEELKMNEMDIIDLQFESDWLKNLQFFSAKGSNLHWDSLFSLFSILESLRKIDVRNSKIDKEMAMELKNGSPRLLEILF